MTAASDAGARLAQALGGGPAARLAAGALIEAEALGQPRFGLDLLEEWTPGAAPRMPEAAPEALRWLDCSGRFAPLAVAGATLDLGRAARRAGIAAVFLRGVKGFGRLAPFVRHLADDGLIGLAAAEGPPFVAPHGGAGAVIGTNPFALAMGQGAGQVVIDVATSSATMAAIRAARETAAPLAEGTALDAQGRPTRIAAEVAALLPRGGQVGSLLGLAVELLAGVAGGGRGDTAGRGVFLLAIAPEAAGELPARLDALREDWTRAGGHWPRGARPPGEARLAAAAAARLEGHLARMTGTGA